MKCEQCDSIGINGVLCHETGCPDSHIDLATGKPYVNDNEIDDWNDDYRNTDEYLDREGK